jgi:hypothetical protein
MQLRGLSLFLAVCLAGCVTHAGGKIMADTKVPTPEDKTAVLIPYEGPDIAALTGIPEPDEADQSEPAAEPAAPPPVTETKQ